MYILNLQWKEFNVSISAVREWIDANLDAECVGTSADSQLKVHFASEPSAQDKSDLQAYWDALESDSDEAEAYMSAADIEADKVAKKASAKTKLMNLGLTEAEANAALGLE